METKLARIAEIARAKPKDQFTSLAHLINAEIIKACHKQMDKNKAGNGQGDGGRPLKKSIFQKSY